MSEFLLDEAMGYNRRQQMDQVGHLANAGLDDRLYDDDFFANRPEPGGQQDGTIIERMGSFAGNEAGGDQQDVDADPEMDNGEDEVVRVRDDDASDAGDEADMDSLAQEGGSQGGRDSDYQSARSHQSVRGQGLIQEEPVNAPVQAPVPQNAGLIQPAGPVTHYSSEPDNAYRESEWLPRRSNKVFGKYWKTFGERKKQAGFWGALFGKGMARANRAAARTAYDTAQLTRARGLRAEQRQADENRGPLRSALRTRLANAEPITGLKTFPREPGIAYDEAAAGQAHRGFMRARKAFHEVNEDVEQDLFSPQFLAAARQREGMAATEAMKTSRDAYDASTGTRRLFGGALRQGPDEKALAITRANFEAGADKFALEGQQRRTPQRVRFADGADDTVGLPVNDPNESYLNKPMPTGVHFFAAPIGSRTLQQDAALQIRREKLTPAFRNLAPEAQKERSDAMKDEHRKAITAYTESGGQIGHPDEISDAQAIENERFAWPIRAQMRRMRSDPLTRTAGQHEAVAMRRAMELGEEQAVDDDTFKDSYIRSSIGNEVMNSRQEERNHDVMKAESRRFATEGLSDGAQAALRMQLERGGYAFDPGKSFTEQMPQLPRRYFDQYLEAGYQRAAQRGAAGAGAGGIIEEEELQQ